jgi:hypothetical protein
VALVLELAVLRHAVLAAEIAAVRDRDPEIIHLAVVAVGELCQSILSGLCLSLALIGLYLLSESRVAAESPAGILPRVRGARWQPCVATIREKVLPRRLSTPRLIVDGGTGDVPKC